MVKFNYSSISPLTNKVILITGGTDGLGKESIAQLAAHSPAHIYATARSQAKADATLKELDARNPKHAPITFLPMDLNSFASIKSAVSSFLAQEDRLDILMCNAGLAATAGLTAEGYEVDFGVNHMGHALLIHLLLPLMQKTARLPETDVRVVILTSDAISVAPKEYPYAELKTPVPKLNLARRYGMSKLANAHYALMLSKQYPSESSKIKFVSVHPGAVYTNLANEVLGRFDGTFIGTLLRWIVGLVLGMVSVEEGAKGQVWGAVGEGVVSGEYYWPIGVTGKGRRDVRDEKMARELWEWTEGELKAHL
jgi:retinol dehydrogenase 12